MSRHSQLRYLRLLRAGIGGAVAAAILCVLMPPSVTRAAEARELGRAGEKRSNDEPATAGRSMTARLAEPGQKPSEDHSEAIEKIRPLALDPFFLSNRVSSQVTVEVDWVEGAEPHPDALSFIRATLVEQLPKGKRLTVDWGDEIPLERWLETDNPLTESGESLSKFVSLDPDGWEIAEPLYILYVPGEWGYQGWASRIDVRSSRGVGSVAALFLFPDEIERSASLWITRRKIERNILAHELGHVLGLVSNPAHQREGDPGHCTRKRCVLAYRGSAVRWAQALPALVGRVPYRFCKACRQDLKEARERWESADTSAQQVERWIYERRVRDERLKTQTGKPQD